MKAVLYVILILVIAAGVCALTCPGREDHVNALENVLQRTIDKELSLSSDFKDDPFVASCGSALLSGVFNHVFTASADQLAEEAVEALK